MATETQTKKAYDLEERTFRFAQNVRSFLKELKPNQVSLEDKKQLIRSSGSVAANYVEANEALSTKDFVMRIKISKKEAKESHLWLRLMAGDADSEIQPKIKSLIQESLELAKIFGAIANKYREIK